MRKLTRKGMKKKIDQLCKDEMLKTKSYQCPTCTYWGRPPATQNLHWGHLITATKLATRWDFDNLVWQCDPCNFLHEQYPEKYTQWFIDTHGYEAYQALDKRSNQPIQNYDIYYKRKLEEYDMGTTL